jgi:hypothetical protein
MQKIDYESVVDGWIARAIKYNSESDLTLKYSCIFASPVVGKYANGGTKQIADGIRRSVSTVENHAHAHWLYQELRRNLSDLKRVRLLWRRLPASHWWLAYDIQNAGYDALYYLDNADLHNWSGRDMIFEYKRDRENGSVPLLFHRACYSFRGLAMELAKQTKRLTPAQIKAVQAVIKEFEER